MVVEFELDMAECLIHVCERLSDGVLKAIDALSFAYTAFRRYLYLEFYKCRLKPSIFSVFP